MADDIYSQISQTLLSLAKRVRRLEVRAFNPSMSVVEGENQISEVNPMGANYLRELLDVNILAPYAQDGQALVYNQIQDKWIPGSAIPEGGGGSGLVGGIWLYDSAGEIADVYPATTQGLTDALVASQSGYVLYLPVCAITHSFTVPSGVKIIGIGRFSSRILGTITLTDGCSLESLTIRIDKNDSSDYCCILSPSSGISYISDCHIQCFQMGSGDGIGLSIVSTGSVEIYNTHLEGFSTGGLGYGGALVSGSGALYHFGGRALGSTTPYKE